MQKFDHPAGFPVEVPIRCIKLHGVDGAAVLDPLAGTGTTLVAAQQLGCCGIGFEEDAAYVAKARERLGDIEQACGGSRYRADSNANAPY